MRQTFHKFRAQTLDQAYLAMRRRLGDEAIVVRTATVPYGGIMGRLLGQSVVELTASATTDEPAGSVASRRLSAVEKKYLATGATADAYRPSLPATGRGALGSDERVSDTVAFFQKLIGEAQRRVGTSATANARIDTAPTGRPTPPMEDGNAAPAEVLAFEAPEPKAAREASIDEIRDDITEMRDMLHALSAEVPGAGLPQEFVQHYQMLLKHGVTRARAASLVKTASKRGDLRAFRDPRVFLERLKMEIRRLVTVTGGIALNAGTRKVVALVGATGVGKTTNLAKLAALYSVQEHARVGVITTDTYRVAATDQLQVYTNIINLDMRTVHDAAEMKAALRAFDGYDLVLIDTAGGSPFNREQMTELRGLLGIAKPQEVHLLVSANTALEDVRDVVTHFSILHPTALFFTKLDETQRYGSLFCLAAEAGLPLSYFSLGQNVPDDIMPASPGTVAKLVIEGGNNSDRTSTEPA